MISPKIEKSFTQLERAKTEILETLATLNSEVLNTPTATNKWSILQILHHTALVESGTLQYIKKKCQKPDQIPRVGFLVPFKMVFLSMVLKSNIKIKAPKILSEPPQKLKLQDLADDWEQTRGSLYHFLEQLPEEFNDKAIFKHPMVGRIGITHMLGFLVNHFEHHEKQIKKYLKTIS